MSTTHSSKIYINLLSLSISLSISNFSYEDRYLEVVLMLSKLERILVVGWFSVLLLTLCFLMPNTGIVISLFFLCTCLYCSQNLLFSFLSFCYIYFLFCCFLFRVCKVTHFVRVSICFSFLFLSFFFFFFLFFCHQGSDPNSYFILFVYQYHGDCVCMEMLYSLLKSFDKNPSA